MSLCTVTVKMKTFMKFCLLTTYNVKGRVTEGKEYSLRI